MNASGLFCSIVVYRSDHVTLERTIRSFFSTADRALGINVNQVQLILVNNDPKATEESTCALLPKMATDMNSLSVGIIVGQGNVGYGRGHNLSIERNNSPYHLVLNPDVVLAEDALVQAIEFMENNPECGLLVPRVFDGEGAEQYLCKRYPTLTDLILRGFMPSPVRRVFRKRLNRYEMRDVIGDEVIWDVPIVSGCFMLFRRSVLERLKGFSPEYFLYFEDFDLSLRAGRITRTAYVPSVRIVHYGGNAAKKGWRHIGMFARSAITFFNQHGWKLW